MAKVKNRKDVASTSERMTVTDTLHLNPAFVSRVKREEGVQQSVMAVKLREDMNRMKDDELFPDMQFVVNNKAIPGHRLIIKSRLRNLADDNFYETTDGHLPTLQIDERSMEDTKEFLKVLYMSEEINAKYILDALKKQSKAVSDTTGDQSECSSAHFEPDVCLSDNAELSPHKILSQVERVEPAETDTQTQLESVEQNYMTTENVKAGFVADSIGEMNAVSALVAQEKSSVESVTEHGEVSSPACSDTAAAHEHRASADSVSDRQQSLCEDSDHQPLCQQEEQNQASAKAMVTDDLNIPAPAVPAVQTPASPNTHPAGSDNSTGSQQRSHSSSAGSDNSTGSQQRSHSTSAGLPGHQNQNGCAGPGGPLEETLEQEGASLSAGRQESPSTNGGSGDGVVPAVSYSPCSDLALGLLRCYLQQVYTDCCLVVEGRRFPAHRCVLASRCQYFDAMFAGSWSESEETEIELHGVSAHAVKCILLFLYGAMLEVPASDITSLIQASDMLGVEGLKDWLGFLIARDFCHFFHKPCQDCIRMVADVLVLTSQFNLTSLAERGKRWVATHFRRIWELPNFGTLPPDLLDECTRAVIDQMTVENITQMILDSHVLARCLQQKQRAEPVQLAAIRVMDEALAFCAAHFHQLVTAPNFLAWSKDGAWCLDVLEESYTMVVSLLQPEVVCDVYSNLTQQLACSENQEAGYTSEEVCRLLRKLVERCEWYLHRYIHRVVNCPQWSTLPSDLQQQLLQKCSFVPAHAASFTGAKSRVAQKSAKVLQDNIVHTVTMLCETDPDLFPSLSQIRKILSNNTKQPTTTQKAPRRTAENQQKTSAKPPSKRPQKVTPATARQTEVSKTVPAAARKTDLSKSGNVSAAARQTEASRSKSMSVTSRQTEALKSKGGSATARKAEATSENVLATAQQNEKSKGKSALSPSTSSARTAQQNEKSKGKSASSHSMSSARTAQQNEKSKGKSALSPSTSSAPRPGRNEGHSSAPKPRTVARPGLSAAIGLPPTSARKKEGGASASSATLTAGFKASLFSPSHPRPSSATTSRKTVNSRQSSSRTGAIATGSARQTDSQSVVTRPSSAPAKGTSALPTQGSVRKRDYTANSKQKSSKADSAVKPSSAAVTRSATAHPVGSRSQTQTQRPVQRTNTTGGLKTSKPESMKKGQKETTKQTVCEQKSSQCAPLTGDSEKRINSGSAYGIGASESGVCEPEPESVSEHCSLTETVSEMPEHKDAEHKFCEAERSSQQHAHRQDTSGSQVHELTTVAVTDLHPGHDFVQHTAGAGDVMTEGAQSEVTMTKTSEDVLEVAAEEKSGCHSQACSDTVTNTDALSVQDEGTMQVGDDEPQDLPTPSDNSEQKQVLYEEGNKVTPALNDVHKKESEGHCDEDQAVIPICCDEDKELTENHQNTGKEMAQDNQDESREMAQDQLGENKELTQVQGENKELTQVQDENKELTQVQDENKESTRVQGENKELTQVQGENKELTQVLGENKELTQVLGENKELTQVQGENKELTQVQGENKELTQVQGENKELTQVQGENKELTQVLGENKELTQVQGENEERTQVQGEKEERTQVQGENEERTQVQGEKEERTQVQGEKEEGTQAQGEKEERTQVHQYKSKEMAQDHQGGSRETARDQLGENKEFTRDQLGENKEFTGDQLGENKEFTGDQLGENKEFTGDQLGENKEFTGDQLGENKEFTGDQLGENKEFTGDQLGGNKEFTGDQLGENKEFTGDQLGENKEFTGDQLGENKEFTGDQLGENKEFTGDHGENKAVTQDHGGGRGGGGWSEKR